MTDDKEYVTKNVIQHYIDKFNKYHEKEEYVLNELFGDSVSYLYKDVFCRAGILDSLYSTCIQRFNKGGIAALSEHIIVHERD